MLSILTPSTPPALLLNGGFFLLTQEEWLQLERHVRFHFCLSLAEAPYLCTTNSTIRITEPLDRHCLSSLAPGKRHSVSKTLSSHQLTSPGSAARALLPSSVWPFAIDGVTRATRYMPTFPRRIQSVHPMFSNWTSTVPVPKTLM